MTHVKHLGIGHVGIFVAVNQIAFPTLGIDVRLRLALLIEVCGIVLSFLYSYLIFNAILLCQQIAMSLAEIVGRLQILGSHTKRKKGYRRNNGTYFIYTHEW